MYSLIASGIVLQDRTYESNIRVQVKLVVHDVTMTMYTYYIDKSYFI